MQACLLSGLVVCRIASSASSLILTLAVGMRVQEELRPSHSMDAHFLRAPGLPSVTPAPVPFCPVQGWRNQIDGSVDNSRVDRDLENQERPKSFFADSVLVGHQRMEPACVVVARSTSTFSTLVAVPVLTCSCKYMYGHLLPREP